MGRQLTSSEPIAGEAERTAESIVILRLDPLERIDRRGELPARAFAALNRETLAAPMDDLFARYTAALAEWPTPAAHDAVIRYENAALGLHVDDRLHDLRVGADGIALDGLPAHS